ncbi:toxin CbtA [Citrobacter sp. FDAARGOS_156]|uniref:TA system toxin CbtA family protein n=1 Tax=Citrobacter sp. FDAARGOS_156 TaxID=1702170 RepID=UPI00076B6362|nr:TA system toxin CbtA family protein [Citrobacter sp. FDAARGOS_156]AMH12955.1 toxin CbtA [Citrobacter sp. FDAARGOS_156]
MQTQPLHPIRAVSTQPSPVEIWQKMLTHLLAKHYGLTLNDTPFSEKKVIQEHIEAGISLCDAVNFIVEKYELVRIDRSSPSLLERPPFISAIDILYARRAAGLMKRDGYKAVSKITNGKNHRQGESR